MKSVTIVKTLSLIALSSLTLVAGPSQAHGWSNPYLPAMQYGHYQPIYAPSPQQRGSVDARQQTQQERIRDGIAEGRISRHEARDLYREQKEIEMAQRRFLADGRLSRDEYLRLDRMLDQADREIRAEQRDRDWR